jgi:hypothetical protein
MHSDNFTFYTQKVVYNLVLFWYLIYFTFTQSESWTKSHVHPSISHNIQYRVVDKSFHICVCCFLCIWLCQRLVQMNVSFAIQMSLGKTHLCYAEVGPPLWSSDQCSWSQIQKPGFDFRCYQIFWEAVGLERGQPSVVSTREEKVVAPI